MRIAVVGTGYVGLVVGACLAETGHHVLCVDSDAAKINGLEHGNMPIYEPGLEELVLRNSEEERLGFTTRLDDAVERSLIVFITVGTPPMQDGSCDLSQVFDVAEGIGKAANGYKVVVNKSTVPVGTARRVRELISGSTDYELDVVSNPEFLKEGSAVEDFMRPDRIVVGVDDVRTAELMKELYAPFVRTGRPIIVMDPESAEMTKHAANAMLATRISLMNELACLCERVGADIDMVRKAVGADTRIGSAFLFPGIGYGGSCFSKDMQSIAKFGEQNAARLTILEAAQDVNRRQRTVIIDKITAHFGPDLHGSTIAVWGLAFKPKTDDMRYAPSIDIINRLLDMGARVNAYDPVSIEEAKRRFGDRISLYQRGYQAVDGADALVILTEWPEFRMPDFDRLKSCMNQRIVFDGRNVFDPQTMARHGFTYYSIGRRSVSADNTDIV